MVVPEHDLKLPEHYEAGVTAQVRTKWGSLKAVAEVAVPEHDLKLPEHYEAGVTAQVCLLSYPAGRTRVTVPPGPLASWLAQL